MKTAMQSLYDEIKTLGDIGLTLSTKDLLMAIGNHYIEVEKQQILSAYDIGKEQPSNSQQSPIEYFNQTYQP
jgi:hypothetical protein